MGNLLKQMLMGLLSGLLAGAVIIGIGGRIAMRGIALMGGLSGGFSWGGTLEVVLLGLIIGTISGAIYGLLNHFFFKPSWIIGSIYGLLVFLAIIVLPIQGKGAAKGFPDLLWAIYLIFGVLHVVYGIVLSFLFCKINRNKY